MSQRLFTGLRNQLRLTVKVDNSRLRFDDRKILARSLLHGTQDELSSCFFLVQKRLVTEALKKENPRGELWRV